MMYSMSSSAVQSVRYQPTILFISNGFPILYRQYMVSNQNNLMYLPPYKVVAAGTDRNIMQAGLQKTWEQDLDERLEYMQYKIDKLTGSMQVKNIKQARTINPEEQRNIQQAGILNKASDKEILDTMLGFMDGSISIEYLPFATAEAMIQKQNQPQQNLKQAALLTKQAKPDDMLQTFMEFGGL